MGGIAYFHAGLRDPREAMRHADFERIRSAGRWSYADWIADGKRGVVAFNGDPDKGVPSPEQFGEPRDCSDGVLVYYPPAELPSQEELARENIPLAIDIETARGLRLSIPVAVGAPHYISFTGSEPIGDAADDFARLAYRVHERICDENSALIATDPEVLQLVCLAMAQTYRVTPELLDDLRWITTADIDPILCAIMGSDPKALPDVGDISPSSGRESSRKAG